MKTKPRLRATVTQLKPTTRVRPTDWITSVINQPIKDYKQAILAYDKILVHSRHDIGPGLGLVRADYFSINVAENHGKPLSATIWRHGNFYAFRYHPATSPASVVQSLDTTPSQAT